MRYHALAVDYDGTLAQDGKVSQSTLAALKRLRASGRRLLLVTGRQLEDLRRIFKHLALFEWIVAENGALLYQPATRAERVLGEPPPAALAARLERAGVEPLSLGHVILATRVPHDTTVLEAIRDLGLEHLLIFNKGNVMVLPSGINKATGLSAALAEMGLSPHSVAGVGDAENDHAFLRLCACSAAVANALPSLKREADLVTKGERGDGVVEVIDQLIEDDLARLAPKLVRHDILLGSRPEENDEPLRLPAYGSNVLLVGPSQSGKSTLSTAVVERLAQLRYQFCLIDPEGDYEDFPEAVSLGSAESAPSVDEVMHLLREPAVSAVVNLLGLRLEDRPAFFASLLPRLQDLRARTGRPHWIVVDEAHHVLPAEWDQASLNLPRDLTNTFLVTLTPSRLTGAVTRQVDVLLGTGQNPARLVRDFAKAAGRSSPRVSTGALEKKKEALIWFVRRREPPFRFAVEPPNVVLRRHRRKYAEGELSEDRSFYFRGPDQRLNLRAHNLALFVQIADGVDDETWLYHLKRGDYSRWFRERIKDYDLAAEVEKIERSRNNGATARASRAKVRKLVESRYTGPE